MKLSEQYYQVEPDGALLLPTDDLRRMGLHPGDRVCFAYLAAESGENLLSEFAVVPAKGEEDSAVGQIQIPEALLSQAGISPGEDVQILCLDGALLICGAETLSLEELKMVRQYLASANGLTEQLAGCEDADLLLLKKRCRKGGRAVKKEYYPVQLAGFTVQLCFAPKTELEKVRAAAEILRKGYLQQFCAGGVSGKTSILSVPCVNEGTG